MHPVSPLILLLITVSVSALKTSLPSLRVTRHYIIPTDFSDSSTFHTITTQQDAIKEGFGAFFQTFNSRLIGAVLGNIAAAAFIKFASDFFFSLNNPVSSTDTAAPSRGSPKLDIPSSAYVTLVACLVIDCIGDTSFLLPGVGELEDVAWAPISSYLLSIIFGSNVVSGLEFIKEILPGTDVIPVATIAWFLQNVYNDSLAAKILGLKRKEEEARLVDTKARVIDTTEEKQS